MIKRILIIFFALTVSNISWAKSNAFRFVEIANRIVPDDVPIFDEKNEKHFMEEYEGTTLLLVFWASWCSQCTNEMVSLDILQKDFRKLDFKIIPISEDYAGIEQAQKFYKKYELRHLPLLHDYKNSLFKAMSITSLPTSIIIDKDGKLIGKFIGDVQWHHDDVRNLLLSYIPNNPVTPKNTYKEISLDQKVAKERVENTEKEKSEATETQNNESSKETDNKDQQENNKKE